MMRVTLVRADGTQMQADVEPDEQGRMPDLIVLVAEGKLYHATAPAFYGEVVVTCVIKPDGEAAEGVVSCAQGPGVNEESGLCASAPLRDASSSAGPEIANP